MYWNSLGLTRKVRLTVLTTAASGMLFASACSMRDIADNLTAGALSFVKGYTADMLETLVPPADELFNLDDGSAE